MDQYDISKIRVIFLDIGGVMLSNGWETQARKKVAKHFNLDYEEMSVLHNFIYNVFEIGSISLDEYLNTVVFNKPRDFGRQEFKDFMYEQSVELPDILVYLKKWKKQTDLPVFALSNENLELNEYRIKKFGLQEVFDGFFSSCYVKARKPDPHIYKAAMQIAHAKPEECLYFDDRPMLVQSAKQLGMIDVLHEDFETTKNILENFVRK